MNKLTLKDRLATVAFVAANVLLAAELVYAGCTIFKPENLNNFYNSLNQTVVETIVSPMKYLR